jgi:hypothetical protein
MQDASYTLLQSGLSASLLSSLRLAVKVIDSMDEREKKRKEKKEGQLMYRTSNIANHQAGDETCIYCVGCELAKP